MATCTDTTPPQGTLMRAVREGGWLLLDEINLASPELLESLSMILEGRSLTVVESGDIEPIREHPDFRLFACMNPSTDVGKKDLPIGVKNRFTEIYVDEVTDETDLQVLVAEYLRHLSLPSTIITKIVTLYLTLRERAQDVLCDGQGHSPCYTVRTLCRALKYAARNSCGNILRSLYEGFTMSFLTALSRTSYPVVRSLIVTHLLPPSSARDIIQHPLPQLSPRHLNIEGYWLEGGNNTPTEDPSYIITPTVRENIADLARGLSSNEYPLLLQGPTSAGLLEVEWAKPDISLTMFSPPDVGWE